MGDSRRWAAEEAEREAKEHRALKGEFIQKYISEMSPIEVFNFFSDGESDINHIQHNTPLFRVDYRRLEELRLKFCKIFNTVK